jgi:hypothetical protein
MTPEEIAAQEEQDRIARETEEEADKKARGDFGPAEETHAEEEVDKDALAELLAEEERETAEKTPAHIPYDRFAEVNAAKKEIEEDRNRLKAELAALADGKKVETDAAAVEADKNKIDLKALRIERAGLIASGDFEEAAAVDEKIEGELSRVAEDRAVERIRKERGEEHAQTAHQTLVAAVSAEADKVAADYACFDSTVAEPNTVAINTLIALRDKYATDAKNPISLPAALRRASDELGPIFGSKKADAADDGKTAAEKKAASEKEAREKAALTSRTQPANIAKVGEGARSSETKVLDKVEQMSEKEFDALPTSDLHKMRGDSR